jgi:phosphonate transport system permease protein
MKIILAQLRTYFLYGIFIALIILSLPAWEGSTRDLSEWENFARFLGRFFPPDFSDSQTLAVAFRETLQIAFLATLAASCFSLFIALLGGPWMPRAGRMFILLLLATIRSVPSIVWAVVTVAIVGPHPRAGVLALMLYSVGYLGKFLLDDFSTLDLSLLHTYRRWGLPPLAAFRFGFWPQLRRRYLAHSIWMLEYNIRSASIIGYVGAGGLGLQLHAYQEYGQWNRFSAVLLLILATVLVFEIVPKAWKRFIQSGISPQPVAD